MFEDINDKIIGERISIARKKYGLTQLELSEKLGISRDLLSNYELGRNRINSVMLYKIALALDETPNNILGFKKDDFEEKISLRYTKRIKKIEKFPEHKIKAILKTLDDFIKANEE